MSGTSKRGRKPKHYISSDGTPVVGLSRRPDGRWRVIATGQEFACADEALAIHRYHTRYAPSTAPDEVLLPVAVSADVHDWKDQLETLGVGRLEVEFERGKPPQVFRGIDKGAFFSLVRQLILKSPEYVAKMTGIEQLAYLGSIQKPDDSPTLEEVGTLYFTKAKITGSWRTKSKLFWTQFGDDVAVRTLRDISQESMIAYRDHVLEKSDNPTYAKHRFGCIKTILRFPRTHGKWALDCDRALAFAAVLVPPESVAMNPRPISRDHFAKLLEEAKDNSALQAILLLALNACMYGKEVSDVRWRDLDLVNATLVMHRQKTKVPRVAVLWQRTAQALEKMPRVSDCPFLTATTKQPHNANTINKLFRTLKRSLGLEVDFNHLRDGAFTAAIGGQGVQWQHAQVLAGHRTGMADAYVLRNPRLVADACKAIEAAYFG